LLQQRPEGCLKAIVQETKKAEALFVGGLFDRVSTLPNRWSRPQLSSVNSHTRRVILRCQAKDLAVARGAVSLSATPEHKLDVFV